MPHAHAYSSSLFPLHIVSFLHPFRAAAGAPNVTVVSRWTNYGAASGIAPGAFLAVYKALWSAAGSAFGVSSDINAAVDQAVMDGCDVISMSLGGGYESYFDDIALLNAAKVREASRHQVEVFEERINAGIERSLVLPSIQCNQAPIAPSAVCRSCHRRWTLPSLRQPVMDSCDVLSILLRVSLSGWHVYRCCSW